MTGRGGPATLETAVLDVRVLPWRPRARVMRPDTLRDGADVLDVVDGLEGLVVGLVLWVAVMIAAPVIVLVLAVALLTVEVPLAIALAVLLVVVRVTGVLPWKVLVVDHVTGAERLETYRAPWRAVHRIREINHDRRVKVHWSWA